MPDSKPPRFSNRPLPPYRFRKHETPHPTQDPDGHFRGKRPFRCPGLDASNWRDCEGYRFALDLFNYRYYWACHEVLEDLWQDLRPGAPVRHFLQAFIQCTVAHWQASSGRTAAAQNLLKRIPSHIAAAKGIELGFSVEALLDATRHYAEDPASEPPLLAIP